MRTDVPPWQHLSPPPPFQERIILYNTILHMHPIFTLRNLFALSLLFSSGVGAQGQTVVADYIPGVTAEGITYFLPETHIRFVLTATRRLYTPGEYAPFAERFLGITDAPTEQYEEWTLEDIAIIPFGVPDRSKAFTIALNPKSSAPLVTLTPDGLLLAINAQTDQPDPLPGPAERSLASTLPDPHTFLTPEIIRASTRSKKAELTAQEIYDIRENRSLLAKGQADFNPTDGEQLKAMFRQLDVSEKALLTMFTGTERTEQHTMVVDYCPDIEKRESLIFRFSKYFGLVDTDDLSGEPYTLKINHITRLSDTAPDSKTTKKKEKQDVRYCIPGRAQITVLCHDKELIRADVSIAQFGSIEHLGGELFNKKFNTQVLLNPYTGNIRNLSYPALSE